MKAYKVTKKAKIKDDWWVIVDIIIIFLIIAGLMLLALKYGLI